MCKDTDANIDACAKVFACMYACMWESHITLQSQKKGFSTQPVRLQGLVDKARKRNEAKSAFDSQWKAQSYKYFRLETNTVIRTLSLFLLAAQDLRCQAPGTKNRQTPISSSESKRPPSVEGNVARHPAWNCAEAVKINVSICDLSKHLSSYQLRDVQFLGSFIIRTRQLLAIQKSH